MMTFTAAGHPVENVYAPATLCPVAREALAQAIANAQPAQAQHEPYEPDYSDPLEFLPFESPEWEEWHQECLTAEWRMAGNGE